jgi:hypothetical protein
MENIDDYNTQILKSVYHTLYNTPTTSTTAQNETSCGTGPLDVEYTDENLHVLKNVLNFICEQSCIKLKLGNNNNTTWIDRITSMQLIRIDILLSSNVKDLTNLAIKLRE